MSFTYISSPLTLQKYLRRFKNGAEEGCLTPAMRKSQAGQFVIVCAIYNTSELYLCRPLSDCVAIDSVCLLYSLFKACHLGEAEK